MKVLYHHRTVAADGQLVHILELTRELEAAGHEVIFVGPGERRRDVAASADSAAIRRRLPGALYELMELAYSFPAFLRLWRAWRRHKPDILYERYNLFFLAGLWLKRLTGIPMLLEVNAPLAEERERFGGLSLRRLARWSQHSVWRGADRVLPVTGVLAAHVEKAGVPAERISVIHNGVGVDFLQHEPASRTFPWSGALVLGFTGFVRDWHGLDRVVQFLADAAPADAQLVVVGDGPARPGLEALAEKRGVIDRVHFTGVVGRADVPDHVASFDIALQPAVVPYASPLKLFEYMAMSRCIVAPMEQNVCEVLTDGQDALLFDQPRPDGLAEALRQACESASLRCRLGAGARQTLMDRGYLWSRNAARVADLGQGLLKERRQ
ncbi:MAG: glycosyltransferase family 4 protein [Alphaproteobacteria bacterium]